MRQAYYRIKQSVLLGGDIVTVYAALSATLAFRFGHELNLDLVYQHLPLFSFLFAIWIVVMFILDLYDLKNSYNTSSLLLDLIRATTINFVLAASLLYFFAPLIGELRPQRSLIIITILTLTGFFVWRKVFYHWIKSNQITNRVLIADNSHFAQALITEINTRPQLGYHVVGNTPHTGLEKIADHCRTHNIDTIVIPDQTDQRDEQARHLFDCLSLGIDIYTTPHLYETITMKVPVEAIGQRWFIDNLTENSQKVYESIKRLSDIIIAGVAMIITVPLVPIIALIIKMESHGPVIFKQIRTGKNGSTFLAMKFRSMVADAEKNGAQWSSVNDPRITRFGRFMRKTRLDEIPQLINIIRGELSIVGPRPERPEFIELLTQSIPFYRQRLLVRPGLTGWAQIKGPAYGGSVAESLEKIKYDLYYIRHRSLWLDLIIMLKTVKTVLSGQGQ